VATDTNTDATDRAISSRAKLYRLTARQCQAMARAGIFRDDHHIELLGGLLVQKMTKNPPHNFTVGATGRHLATLLTPHWVVWEEKSVELARRWQPEPDIAVLIGPDRRYESVTPTAADVVLLVEVADTSYARDRGRKWRKYAAAGIPTYWIVNLAKRQVEVYRQPQGKGVNAAYGSVEIYSDDAAVPVVIGDQEVGRLNVADLLPRAPIAGA